MSRQTCVVEKLTAASVTGPLCQSFPIISFLFRDFTHLLFAFLVDFHAFFRYNNSVRVLSFFSAVKLIFLHDFFFIYSFLLFFLFFGT